MKAAEHSQTIVHQISKIKRQVFSHPQLIRILIVSMFLILILGGFYRQWGRNINLIALIGQSQTAVRHFIDPTSALTQTNNRTNILILGIGGADHQAADLTDSIILVSIKVKEPDILVLPLPRDIWIPSLRAKLNTAYHYGEQKQTSGGGLILAKAAVSEITDLPIHYVILIDFEGFKKLIDLLGGVDVEVTRSFDDYRYPIPGKENAEPEELRYEHIHFEAGRQPMNGETALKYVRSRNAEGDEGTDLARSERQKQILLAIKNKFLSTKVIFNKSKLLKIKDTIEDSLITDIDQNLYPAMARLALDFKSKNLKSANIPIYLETNNGNTASESALLIHPEIDNQYDYQWVLEPKSGDFTQIHEYIKCLITKQVNSCP